MYVGLFDIVPQISDALSSIFKFSISKFMYPFLCVSSLPLSPLNDSSFLCPVSLRLEAKMGLAEAGEH